MVLLRDFIGKTVWDSYLSDSRRRQWSSKDFFVLSLTLHMMLASIYWFIYWFRYNGLDLSSNVSRGKML